MPPIRTQKADWSGPLYDSSVLKSASHILTVISPLGMEASVGGVVDEVQAFKTIPEAGKTLAKTKPR